MKIMGGPFSEVPVCPEENSPHLSDALGPVWMTGSGSAALLSVLRQIRHRVKEKKIWLPAYYCDGMNQMIRAQGFEIDYYPTVGCPGRGIRALPDPGQLSGVVLLMEYYGFSATWKADQLDQLREKGVLLIEDVTHSLLRGSWHRQADFWFGSLRKWTGVYTGGFYAGTASIPPPLDARINTAFVDSLDSFFDAYTEYLYTGQGDRGFFRDSFWQAQKALEADPEAIAIDPRDLHRLKRWNTALVRRKRRKNARLIFSEIRKKEVFLYPEMEQEDMPFFVPIFIPEKREKICSALDDENIYCSILWTRPRGCSARCNLYDADFGLVCDERYGAGEIEKMVGIINKRL